MEFQKNWSLKRTGVGCSFSFCCGEGRGCTHLAEKMAHSIPAESFMPSRRLTYSNTPVPEVLYTIPLHDIFKTTAVKTNIN